MVAQPCNIIVLSPLPSLSSFVQSLTFIVEQSLRVCLACTLTSEWQDSNLQLVCFFNSVIFNSVRIKGLVGASAHHTMPCIES